MELSSWIPIEKDKDKDEEKDQEDGQ